MMNQTEILKVRGGPENSCMQNIQTSSFSNQLSGVTIIKANTYQSIRDKTPKAQILTKTNSSNKLIRVSSTKGINVVSIRPTSTQKQVRQFNYNNYMSLGGSQTTIKMEESHLINQMRQQLKKTTQRYQEKINQQLSYQHNYFVTQIQRLRQLLILNQGKLSKQHFQIQQLLKRVQTVQRKIEAKTNSMSKQLNQFKKFYQQCHTYTLKRINESQENMKSFYKIIQQATSTMDRVQVWRYIQYVNNLAKNIIVNTSAQTSSLKYYLDDQIYELQLGIGKFQQQYDQIDKIVYQMKNVKFGNDSLRQSIRQLQKFGTNNTNNSRKDNYKQNILQYYEPRFKEIIKRVNNSTIQVDLVKGLIKTQSEAYYKKSIIQQQKITQLSKIIQTLKQKIDEDKIWYTNQLAEKQQLVCKSNPRILQLETRLHSYFQQQAKMMNQISELNLKISYYQTKCEKNSQRQFGIQSTLAEAFSETIVKQKVKIFIQEKKVLQDKITDLNDKIKKLDNQNYLLAKKLSQTQEARQQNIKLQAQLKFVSKMLQKNEQGSKRLLQSETKYRQQKQKMQKQNEQRLKKVQLEKDNQNKYLQQQIKKYQTQIGQMQKQIEQQRNKSQQYESKLLTMIKQRNSATQDDDQYFQQLEQEVEKNYKQIQRLQNINKELTIKNKQLIQKNQELQDDLHNYAQTFQKQSITFRTALQNLQKQKDFMAIQFKKVGQENKILKMDLEQTKTAQSFYEQNNTAFSIQLRKTVSTDLGEPKIANSPPKKLQKKTIIVSNSKSRPKYTHPSIKASKLRSILEKLKYELPVVCQLDATGYLKDQRTGCYFVDEGDNYFCFDQEQLAYAVKIGLIVL